MNVCIARVLFLCVLCFRLQTLIWEQVARSIIGSSTTRSCFPSTLQERSELRCHWTERSEEVNVKSPSRWMQFVESCQWLWFSVILKVKGHYFLIVEAWDGAVDPRRSRLTLSVTVLDIDDNSPVFTQRTYNVSLAENSPKDKVILQLKVSKWIYTVQYKLFFEKYLTQCLNFQSVN